jgi:hypothetical protein
VVSAAVDWKKTIAASPVGILVASLKRDGELIWISQPAAG